MYIYLMMKNILLVVLTYVVFLFGLQTISAQNTASYNTNNLVQPPYLKVGDTVAIVAPSGILKNKTKEMQSTKNLLKSWGLHIVMGDHVYNQNNHFAGTDDERCEDFQKALDSPSISAILCARGGYGTVRILDKLDYTKFREHPKWLIGFSDITALHNQFHNEGFESLHAMMATSMIEDTEAIKETIATFKDAIFGKPLQYRLKGSPYNRVGVSSGQLVGGNLTLLHTMLGSNTSIDVSGKILFIEEVGEHKYHIDRMLQSLKRAGYFENCKGLIVGDINKVRKNTTPWGSSMQQLILDALAEYNFPIAFNMPAGHEDDNRALILGRTVQLTVEKEKTTLVFQK